MILKNELAYATGRIAVVADLPARVRAWFEAVTKRNDVISIAHLLPEEVMKLTRDGPAAPKFDSVVCCVETAPPDTACLLAEIAGLLRPDGTVLLSVGRAFSEVEQESVSPAQRVGCFTLVAPEGLIRNGATGVRNGKWGDVVQKAMLRCARASVSAGMFGTVCWLLLAAGLAGASVLFNVASLSARKPVGSREFSSQVFRFRKAVSDGRRRVTSDVEGAAVRAKEIVR